MGSSSSKAATASSITSSVVPTFPPNEQYSGESTNEHDNVSVAKLPTRAQEQSLSLTSTTTTSDTTKKRECPFKMFWTKEDTPSEKTNSKNDSKTSCPVTTTTNQQGGGCPVKHTTTSDTNSSTQQYPAYNVYSQPINPNNQMPSETIINQLPAPTQTVELSTERVKSTIPKGGTDDQTWTYPSPQMFYNALARKGKLENPEEQLVMESVVHLHNEMNEATWNKILQWEDLEYSSDTPKLLKFCGRPSDLSPKARFKHFVLGHPLPFDRHDWTLLRSDGQTVRYVIDYYYDETSSLDTTTNNSNNNILVDVRPALDTPSSVYHRAFLMPLARRGLLLSNSSSSFEPLPMVPSPLLKQQTGESKHVWETIQKRKKGPTEVDTSTNTTPIPEEEAVKLAKIFAQSLKECQKAQKAVNLCQNDKECTEASLNLTMCMSKILCPIQHKAVVQSVHSNDDDEDVYTTRLNAALENATQCIGQVHEKIAWSKTNYPHACSQSK